MKHVCVLLLCTIVSGTETVAAQNETSSVIYEPVSSSSPLTSSEAQLISPSTTFRSSASDVYVSDSIPTSLTDSTTSRPFTDSETHVSSAQVESSFTTYPFSSATNTASVNLQSTSLVSTRSDVEETSPSTFFLSKNETTNDSSVVVQTAQSYNILESSTLSSHATFTTALGALSTSIQTVETSSVSNTSHVLSTASRSNELAETSFNTSETQEAGETDSKIITTLPSVASPSPPTRSSSFDLTSSPVSVTLSFGATEGTLAASQLLTPSIHIEDYEATTDLPLFQSTISLDAEIQVSSLTVLENQAESYIRSAVSSNIAASMTETFITATSSYQETSSRITVDTLSSSISLESSTIALVTSHTEYHTVYTALSSSSFASSISSTSINSTDTMFESTFTPSQTEYVSSVKVPTASDMHNATSHVVTTTAVSTDRTMRPNTFRIIISFKGGCERIKTTTQLQMEFLESLVSVLTTTCSEILRDNMHLESLNCNPLSVGIRLSNVSKESVFAVIDKSMKNGSFIVPVIDDGHIVEYKGDRISFIPQPEKIQPKSAEPAIEETEVIIIAIASFLFMVLMFFGSVLICRECYLRKRAASFNLLDIPHVNLKLTDFTLTRIPRPHTIYVEPGSNRSYQNHANGKHSGNGHYGSNANENERLSVNAEQLHLRMHDHEEGLVIGVTCTPPHSPAHDSTSGSSSPRSETLDPSRQVLLKERNSMGRKGTSNPNYSADEDVAYRTDGMKIEDYNAEEDVIML